MGVRVLPVYQKVGAYGRKIESSRDDWKSKRELASRQHRDHATNKRENKMRWGRTYLLVIGFMLLHTSVPQVFSSVCLLTLLANARTKPCEKHGA